MADKFELFRLSLLERDQFELFQAGEMSREAWLGQAFGKELPFSHHGTEFFYSPAPLEDRDEVIIGRIGRHVFREENLPPDEGLADITREAWIAALLVLDPSEHDDGQKLAVQSLADVGKPSALIRRLIEAMNDSLGGPYKIEPSKIVEAQSFWDYVEENKGRVTSITFDLIAPNMLGADDEFHDEMRQFKESEKAKKVKLSLQNDEGINADTDRVRRAANYALTESRGSIKARASGAPSYNSNSESKIIDIEGIVGKGAELINSARELANRILGRE